MQEFSALFEGVGDPRRSNVTRHSLHEMLMIALDYAAFALGWYGNGRGWGRLADILEAWNGFLMVSDDRAGGIVSYVYGVRNYLFI